MSAGDPSFDKTHMVEMPRRNDAVRSRSRVVTAFALTGVVLALVVLFASCCGRVVAQPAAATPQATFLPSLPHDRTGSALSAFDKAFYVESGGKAYFRTAIGTGRANPWTQAEMIEMVEDAYQTTHKPVYRSMVVALERGVVSNLGGNWTRRPWNDDIMWLVLSSLRAYDITGNVKCRDRARRNFDAVYARAWDATSGGMRIATDSAYENMATNGVAIICACKLYQDLHQKSYLNKAIRTYRWVRTHLYDAKTGAVADGFSPDAASSSGRGGTVSHAQLSYNYGVLIGAANLLYQATHDNRYYQDASRALLYARQTLTVNGILRNESSDSNGNLGGLKGIFARWAVRFTTDNHISTYDSWFQQNADAAWAHRNSNGLMGPSWSVAPSENESRAWDCASGVVMVVVAPAAGKR